MSRVHIETRTIDVSVMRVGEKQMTMAVLRQLPDEDPCRGDSHFQLREGITPWGHVAIDEGTARKEFLIYEENSSLKKYSLTEVIHPKDFGSSFQTQIYIAI